MPKSIRTSRRSKASLSISAVSIFICATAPARSQGSYVIIANDIFLPSSCLQNTIQFSQIKVTCPHLKGVSDALSLAARQQFEDSRNQMNANWKIACQSDSYVDMTKISQVIKVKIQSIISMINDFERSSARAAKACDIGLGIKLHETEGSYFKQLQSIKDQIHKDVYDAAIDSIPKIALVDLDDALDAAAGDRPIAAWKVMDPDDVTYRVMLKPWMDKFNKAYPWFTNSPK
jgi:hypothetical protein